KGGLALLWKEELEVTIQSYSLNHIDATVEGWGGQSKWRLTGIYSFPEAYLRGRTWSLLEKLVAISNMPWLCFGDFNEILTQEEKVGDRPRVESHMQAFRTALDKCGLKDLGYKGVDYTWSNGRWEMGHIRARLDRFVSTLSVVKAQMRNGSIVELGFRVRFQNFLSN
ncbi:Exo_endo_phos domain-containing protein, partial [Cephalotus follicularis]